MYASSSANAHHLHTNEAEGGVRGGGSEFSSNSEDSDDLDDDDSESCDSNKQ